MYKYSLKNHLSTTNYTVKDFLDKKGNVCDFDNACGVRNTLGGYSLISDIKMSGGVQKISKNADASWLKQPSRNERIVELEDGVRYDSFFMKETTTPIVIEDGKRERRSK